MFRKPLRKCILNDKTSLRLIREAPGKVQAPWNSLYISRFLSRYVPLSPFLILSISVCLSLFGHGHCRRMCGRLWSGPTHAAARAPATAASLPPSSTSSPQLPSADFGKLILCLPSFKPQLPAASLQAHPLPPFSPFLYLFHSFLRRPAFGASTLDAPPLVPQPVVPII